MKIRRMIGLWMVVVLMAVMMTACGGAGDITTTDPSNVPIDGKEMISVELKPGVDSYQEIDADTQNRVCDVLRARLAAAGIEDFDVRIDEPVGDFVVTYPKGAKDEVSEKMLTQVGKLSICDPDGNEVMNNDDVASASASIDTSMGDDYAQYVIRIEFNEEGTEKFKELTEDYMNQQTFFYIDDELVCSPMIQVPITDGQAMISGDLTAEEAQRIATLINASPLPFPLNVELNSEGGADAA